MKQSGAPPFMKQNNNTIPTVAPRSMGFSGYHMLLGSTLNQHAKEYQKYYALSHKRHGDMVEMMDSIEERRIVLAILTASLLEAVANVYLALKLNPSQFAIFEMCSVIDKWVVIPSLILPNFSFPKGGDLHESLTTLIRRRNWIAHMKPQVECNGKRVHKGNCPKTSKSDHQLILGWLALPVRLIDNLAKYDTSAEFRHLEMSLQVQL